ncbi:MAG: nitrite reductase small subunit NirD [Azonexus sp.]
MTTLTWKKLCALADIPALGSRVVERASGGDIAVFRTSDDAVFAVLDACPHKQGPLSQGIVHGHKVTCPLHGQNIDLESGQVVAPDTGCTRRFNARVDNGEVWLEL